MALTLNQTDAAEMWDAIPQGEKTDDLLMQLAQDGIKKVTHTHYDNAFQ